MIIPTFQSLPVKGPFKDLTGKTFNLLTVMGIVGRDAQGRVLWLCSCACGKTAQRASAKLISGDSVSCGCYFLSHRGKWNVKHGQSNTPTYITWRAMLRRCLNPNGSDYPNYGGRGITVCDRWRGVHGFENFLADMGERPSMQHTLEREDNQGDYEPSNCRWATIKEQNQNKRNSHLLTLGDTTQTVSAWCAQLNIPTSTMHSRLSKGWSVARVLTTPVRPKLRCRQPK